MIKLRVKTENIKVKELFNKLGIPDEENAMVTIPFPLKVNTPYGYKRIITAFRTENQTTVTTYFGNNKTLKTSENHRLRVNSEWKFVKDINIGDVVESLNGETKVIDKKAGESEVLYDISVEDVHCYYSNGILSHNSWILAKLGAEALRQGKNVLHITLELRDTYVGLRYDSCFTGIDFQNIRKNVDVVKQKIVDIPGKLIIKYYPIKTISAHTIKIHAERVSMLGTKIDMIIVDYADILRPAESGKNSNSYQDAGGIYEELRAIAGELQIPVWSASQCNRSSLEEDIIQANSIADSYRKIMTADFVMSVSRKVDDKANNTARFHVIKNRFGPDGLTFPAKMNTGNGDIQLFSEDSIEGSRLMNSMGNEEENMKKEIANKWKAHRDED